ncbi:MAG: division/cell wall cluster transcriptional repressor MraZ [Bacteroidales bacterium]|nr:division/cell wall cluster transcriptional repressor MraZ [Bacteroidales bacterium]
MINFVGDHTCKLDAKGRVMLPSGFLKQMSGGVPAKFIVKKDVFESCLVLYPSDEWDRQVALLKKKLNPYKKEHNTFLRVFYKGVAEVEPDANNRILLPKRLLDEIEADKDIVLAGQSGKIEIWAKARYDKVELADDEFAALAEKLLDGLTDEAIE